MHGETAYDKAVMVLVLCNTEVMYVLEQRIVYATRYSFVIFPYIVLIFKIGELASKHVTNIILVKSGRIREGAHHLLRQQGQCSQINRPSRQKPVNSSYFCDVLGRQH